MKLKDWRLCENIPVIYGILNTKTEKWYIGSCINMRNRMRRHYYYLIHNNHHSKKLQRSWNLYGEDCFEVYVLFNITETDTMFDIEEAYIKKYNSKDNGYNILDYCRHTNTFIMSKESKEKAGKTHRKKVIAINRFTNEIYKTYNSITEASEDIKESTSNISQVCKGKLRYVKNYVFVYENEYDSNKDYKVTTHYMKGKTKDEAWKAKARKGNKKAKIIYKFDISGNLVCTYSSRRYAEQQEGFKNEFLRCRLGKELNGYIFTDKKELKI